jgi:hypothetical protein
MKLLTLAASAALVLASGVAQAALHDRGGGLLYDDVLNVTWLQDANYAKTSGYDTDGRMNWTTANTWAANLSFHDSVRNVELTGWRLAANTPVYVDWNYNYVLDGSTDIGYNIASPHSELSYMYYVNLGLKGFYSSTGIEQPDFGVLGNGGPGFADQATVGPVNNLQSYFYWSGTAYTPDSATPNPATPRGWYFSTYDGFQHRSPQTNENYAWAVRPGDVAAPIPEPEAYAMMFAGLGLLGVAARRRNQKVVA